MVVVVVVVEAVVDGIGVVDEVKSSSLKLKVAVLACSRSFSIEMGVVEGVGQPVNSVVALVGGPFLITTLWEDVVGAVSFS